MILIVIELVVFIVAKHVSAFGLLLLLLMLLLLLLLMLLLMLLLDSKRTPLPVRSTSGTVLLLPVQNIAHRTSHGKQQLQQ